MTSDCFLIDPSSSSLTHVPAVRTPFSSISPPYWTRNQQHPATSALGKFSLAQKFRKPYNTGSLLIRSELPLPTGSRTNAERSASRRFFVSRWRARVCGEYESWCGLSREKSRDGRLRKKSLWSPPAAETLRSRRGEAEFWLTPLRACATNDVFLDSPEFPDGEI